MAGIIHELRCERCHLRAYHRTEAECLAALLEELHGTALRQTACASTMSTALMERDAARAALVEETARRLWCEWYLREIEGQLQEELCHWHSDIGDDERGVWRVKAREALEGRA